MRGRSADESIYRGGTTTAPTNLRAAISFQLPTRTIADFASLFHFFTVPMSVVQGPRRCQFQMTSATDRRGDLFRFLVLFLLHRRPSPRLPLFPLPASPSHRLSFLSSFPDRPPPPQFAFPPCHPQIWSRQNQTYVTGDAEVEAESRAHRTRSEPRMEQISE